MSFDGLIDGEFRPLTRQSGRSHSFTPTAEVEAMGSLGGTAPGSWRCSLSSLAKDGPKPSNS